MFKLKPTLSALPICVICFLISLISVFAEESLTITTYYPSPYGSYRELRAQRIAIGDTYINGSAYCWEGTCTTAINTDADLVVEGNVGIGTTSPQSPAPNNQPGNLDANDVYLRSAGKWVSASGVELTGTLNIATALSVGPTGTHATPFTVTINGAKAGDVVLVGLPSNYTSCGPYSAKVSASNTVAINFWNVYGGSSCTVPSGNYTVKVIQK